MGWGPGAGPVGITVAEEPGTTVLSVLWHCCLRANSPDKARWVGSRLSEADLSPCHRVAFLFGHFDLRNWFEVQKRGWQERRLLVERLEHVARESERLVVVVVVVEVAVSVFPGQVEEVVRGLVGLLTHHHSASELLKKIETLIKS